MSKFPDCFPENFESDILPEGAEKKRVRVYRIAKRGIIDRDAFISTYEEVHRKIIPTPKHFDPNDPGLYSTSCFGMLKDAEYILKLIMRHHPEPIIIRGVTDEDCGPCQFTKDRKKSQNNSHYDWWVYEDSCPHIFFEKVDKDE